MDHKHSRIFCWQSDECIERSIKRKMLWFDLLVFPGMLILSFVLVLLAKVFGWA